MVLFEKLARKLHTSAAVEPHNSKPLRSIAKRQPFSSGLPVATVACCEESVHKGVRKEP